MERTFLDTTLFRMQRLKALGERAIDQLGDADLLWRTGPWGNSIAVIVQHLRGNMLSRWTDFLTTDGEKPWRDRDGEFTEPATIALAGLRDQWNEGWTCFFGALESLEPADLSKTIKIRGQNLGVLDAILRQVSQYSYHVGQIVTIAREIRKNDWQTLSIARGASNQYRANPGGRD